MNSNLKTIIGKQELPVDSLKRSLLLEFADSQHVLGQMASAWEGKTTGKTAEFLENGSYRAKFDCGMLQFEMGRIERALEGSGIEPILLKGASYVAKGLMAGKGRRVSDIDILVPESELEEVEKLLVKAGWCFDEVTDNEYDQAYYRKYMHELPPLRHSHRRTIIDVHHRILPRTARIKVDSQALIKSAEYLEGRKLKVFNRVDSFLHSAIHTFADGSFDTPARSLIELYYLFSDIEENDKSHLLSRGGAIGAEQPLAIAMWCLSFYFGDQKAKELGASLKAKPGMLLKWSLCQKLDDVLGAKTARLFLYIRSHYLRMPFAKLLWHVSTKGYRRFRKQPALPLPPGFE